MSRIALVGASPSSPSRSSTLLDDVEKHVRSAGFQVERIEVRELDPAALMLADWNHPDIRAAIDKLARADAVVIATPVYKAAYSGLLKTLLDLLPRDAFENKSILPIATGGTLAHLLSIDYALRPVLCALQAERILAGCFVLDTDIASSGSQRGITCATARQRLETQVAKLLGFLEPARIVALAKSA